MRRMMLALLAGAPLTGCDDGGSENGNSPIEISPPEPIMFHFKMIGDASGLQDFRAATDDPAVIRTAREQLRLPEHERHLHINGAIARGDGWHNLEWSWRFILGEWSLVEVSMELCDGNAVLVEQAVDYWVDTVQRFCPWGAYVAEEVGSLPEATSQVIVGYGTDLSEEQLEAAIETARDVAAELGIGLSYLRAGALHTHVYRLDRAYEVGRVEELVAALEAADPMIDYAEPDATAYPQ